MWQQIKVHNPYGPKSRYVHERVQSPKHFDQRSLRTVPSGQRGVKVIVGCPSGFYSPSRNACKVGTEVQAILKPKANRKRTRYGAFEPGGAYTTHRTKRGAVKRFRKRARKGKETFVGFLDRNRYSKGVRRSWLSKHPVKRYTKGKHRGELVYYGVRRKNVRPRRRYSTREGTLGKKSKTTRFFGGRIPSSSYLAQGYLSKSVTKSIRRHKRKRNQNIVTDAFAGKIAEKIASKVDRYFKVASPHKRRPAKRKYTKRRNPGLFAKHGLRRRYSTREGKGKSSFAFGFGGKEERQIKKSISRHTRKTAKRKRKNPHLAIIGGVNPKRRYSKMARRRRRRLPRRNARGQFIKATSRRRRRNVVNPRRRRHTRAAPRRRRRRNARVTVKIRRRRYNRMAARKRRHTRRRRHNAVHRRRRYSRASNPKVRRRRHHNPRRRRRSYHRRRRNAALSGLVGRVNFMQVLEVAGGVFLGDKLTTYLGNTVSTWLGVTDATMNGAIKAGLGVLGAGLLWRVRPALALGVAVGAANGLLNQYVFAPLWGYATPYLPGGMAGLADYQTRGWKVDNWLPGGAAVAGLGRGGNPLLTKGL